MFPKAPLFSAEGAAPPPSGRAFFLRGEDGVKIRVAYWRGAGRGLAMFLPGRTEFIEKYYGVFQRLLDLGFNVAAIDWRGQGLSERPLANPLKGHVRDFAEYQQDLDLALDTVVRAGAPASDQAPWIMMAHSMGGAIGLRALMRRAPKPKAAPIGRFAAAIFSAPMIGIAASAPLRWAMWAVSALCVSAGRGDAYVLGGSDRTFADDGFEDNPLTSDPHNFERLVRLTAEHPDLALASNPTWAWLSAALKEMRALRPTPTPMLFGVGDEESIVDAEAVRAFAQRAPQAHLIELPGARHELLIEKPALQERFWSAVQGFLDESGV